MALRVDTAGKLLRRVEDIPLYYIATMVPTNEEDDDRIARHQQNRAGSGFTTIEITRDVDLLIGRLESQSVILLDSLTALLLNEMLGDGGKIRYQTPAKIAADLVRLADHFDNIILVSDYIYSDAALYDELTSAYRHALALLDRTAASFSDVVVEACFGNYIAHKGSAVLARLEESERP